MIKAAIFDVDGVLLDSMPIWMDAGARYLSSMDVNPEPDLTKVLWNMSIPEGAEYLKNHYNLKVTKEEIAQGIISKVRDFYYEEVSLKPGVKDFLEELKKRGIPMVIATSSDRSYLNAAFKRTGIDSYFKKVFTCEEIGAGKTKPDIYLAAGEYLEENPSDIIVFEDVIHAVRSAKSARFQVVGIYDAASEKHMDLMKEDCNLYLTDFTEAEKFWTYVEEN